MCFVCFFFFNDIFIGWLLDWQDIPQKNESKFVDGPLYIRRIFPVIIVKESND